MRAAAAGSVVALLLDLLMLSAGNLDLFPDPGVLGGFYDVQGRAILDGSLAVDPARAASRGSPWTATPTSTSGPCCHCCDCPCWS